MLLTFLEPLCLFLFGYLLAVVFTHEDDGVSITLLLPALIAELFLTPIIIIMRTGSWWGGGDAAGEFGRLIQSNWYWALIGFIIFWLEQWLSTLLDLYEDDETIQSNASEKVNRKEPFMGTSSSNFHKKSLDTQTITVIKLTHCAFGHLDRQVSASLEANLNIRPNQRKNVQRLLAEVIDQKPSAVEAIRLLKSMQQGRHNAAYGIFDKLCMIAAHSQRYSQKTLENLISIAQQLGLAQEEIYYLFQKSRLAA